MKITSFDRATTKALRSSLDNALKGLENQFGISIHVGNATFTPDNVTFKVNVATVGESGEVMTKEASAFQQLAKFYGLEPEHLFKTFSAAGEQYKIVGLKTKSPKFPILAKRLKDGKTYKFSEKGLSLRLT
jgi:hypothetical protein